MICECCIYVRMTALQGEYSIYVFWRGWSHMEHTTLPTALWYVQRAHSQADTNDGSTEGSLVAAPAGMCEVSTAGPPPLSPTDLSSPLLSASGMCAVCKRDRRVRTLADTGSDSSGSSSCCPLDINICQSAEPCVKFENPQNPA